MADIASQYQQLLGREPDPSGLAYYQKLLADGASMADVASRIGNSPEAQVRGQYQEWLGRVPDAGGLQYYMQNFDSLGGVPGVRQSIQQSPEFMNTLLDNWDVYRHAARTATANLNSQPFVQNPLLGQPSSEPVGYAPDMGKLYELLGFGSTAPKAPEPPAPENDPAKKPVKAEDKEPPISHPWR